MPSGSFEDDEPDEQSDNCDGAKQENEKCESAEKAGNGVAGIVTVTYSLHHGPKEQEHDDCADCSDDCFSPICLFAAAHLHCLGAERVPVASAGESALSPGFERSTDGNEDN